MFLAAQALLIMHLGLSTLFAFKAQAENMPVSYMQQSHYLLGQPALLYLPALHALVRRRLRALGSYLSTMLSYSLSVALAVMSLCLLGRILLMHLA